MSTFNPDRLFFMMLDGCNSRAVRTADPTVDQGVGSAVLEAFDPAVTDSRLLITSRFPFRLAVDGRGLAERLRIPEAQRIAEILRRFGMTCR